MNEQKNEDKKEFKRKEPELVDFNEFLNDKPEWIKEAFGQYTGWLNGKMVAKEEFEKSYNNFSKAYLGG